MSCNYRNGVVLEPATKHFITTGQNPDLCSAVEYAYLTGEGSEWKCLLRYLLSGSLGFEFINFQPPGQDGNFRCRTTAAQSLWIIQPLSVKKKIKTQRMRKLLQFAASAEKSEMSRQERSCWRESGKTQQRDVKLQEGNWKKQQGVCVEAAVWGE